MSASRSGSDRGRGAWARRTGLLVGVLLAIACPALADAPIVRLGTLQLTPTALLQLDGGGTFGSTAEGGQGSGANVRRARVGGTLELADTVKPG